MGQLGTKLAWDMSYFGNCPRKSRRNGHLNCMTQVPEQICKKLKFSRHSPVVAQRVGRGIALLFHDRGTRRVWVDSSTPRPYFIPGKAPVPIVQEGGWAPGPFWRGGKSRNTRIRSPDRPACGQSLYRLNYLAHRSRYVGGGEEKGKFN